MARHIVDALIVELGLDPSRFNEGQRKALDSMRDMEERMRRTSDRMSRGRTSPAARIGQAFADIQTPIRSGIRQLEQLGEAARGSSSVVVRAAGAGASGLSAMATAGLGAYAALKSINAVIGEINQKVARAAQTGRTGAYANLPVNYVSAFGIAAERMTGADRGRTEALLLQVRRSIDQFKISGEMDATLQGFQSLGRFGVTIDWYNENIPSLMEKVSEAFSRMGSLHAATSFAAQNLGMDPQLAEALYNMRGRAGVRGAVAGAMPIATTEAEAEAARELERAILKVRTAWTQLVTTVVEKNPELKQGLEIFAGWLESLRDKPELVDKLTAAIGALAAVIGGRLLFALMRLLLGATLFRLLGPLALPFIGYGIYQSLPDSREKSLWNWLVPPIPTRPRGGGEGGDAQPGIWQRFKNWWQGGSSEGSGSSVPPRGTGQMKNPTVGGVPRFPDALGVEIAKAEGTFDYDKNRINYDAVFGNGAYARPPKPVSQMTLRELYDWQRNELLPATGKWNTTASGAFQITSQNIKDISERFGLDMDKTTFSPETQNLMRDIIRTEQGFGAWEGFKTHPDNLARAMSIQPTGVGKTGGTAVSPPGAGGKFSSTRDLSQVDPLLVSTVRQAAGMLPKGYRVEVTSGRRYGSGGSQHNIGNALDVQIYDPQGKPIPKRGADTTGMYKTLAQSWYNVILQQHPELAESAAWGGEFETSPGSGVPDLMHFDLGGRRGRYRRDDWRQPFSSRGAMSRGGMMNAGLERSAYSYSSRINQSNDRYDINVTVPPADSPAATGAAIGDSLRRSLTMSSANTGIA